MNPWIQLWEIMRKDPSQGVVVWIDREIPGWVTLVGDDNVRKVYVWEEGDWQLIESEALPPPMRPPYPEPLDPCHGDCE